MDAVHVKYEMEMSNFKPVNYKNVRWLRKDENYLMKEFWNMTDETWNASEIAGYTYCAVVEDDRILSVAAVWKYSDESWEVAAVNTGKGYENRGLAKQVVSFVTEYILKSGRKVTLTTDKENKAMRKVAEDLGFEPKEFSKYAYKKQ